MNICLAGHGMMGTWHAENLRDADCGLRTLVGPQAEPAKAFAEKHGFAKWTTDYLSALADPEIDAVIVATPSEIHAAQAIAALERGKHVLVEIPIAMSLADAERVVAAAKQNGRVLAVCHPRRFGAAREALCRRIQSGEERARLVDARFFIHRLSNVGATGLKREWTDNLLWHHVAHLVDFGLWILTGGDLAEADRRIARFSSYMPPVETLTGIPMEAALIAETVDHQALVCSGSYYSRAWIYDLLVVTDKQTYRFDELKGTMTTHEGENPVEPQQRECQLAALDFLEVIRRGGEPRVPGWSVLPAMRLLERTQREWDERHGATALPGRPLPVEAAQAR
jgi:2-hydroxy-4-carboxymuconate semialdehyde hemiacetal dehydrogenase